MSKTKRSLTFSSLVLGLVAAVTFAAPVAADPAATIGTIERDRCTLSIPVTVGDAVEYELQIWDDGVMLHNQTFTPTAAAETVILTYTLVSDINQGAAGIGIEIYADTALVDNVDPYDFPGSDDIARACADSGGTDSGESTTTTTTEVDVTTTEVDVTTTEVDVTTTEAPSPQSTDSPNAPAAAQAARPVAATPSYTG